MNQVSTYAPGRLEFIGNHTDYNGGMVLGVAIDKGIRIDARQVENPYLTIESEGQQVRHELALPLEPLSGDDAWANYPLGVFKVMQAAGLKAQSGVHLQVCSNLPTGAGLSSSAAFELATAYALAALFDWEGDKATFARLARQAENEFVGVPCGILDQGVSAFGEKDHLVHIDCHTEKFSTLPLPKGLKFVVFNSCKKHSLVDSLYSVRHQECTSAFKVLREQGGEYLAAVSPEQIEAARKQLSDEQYKRALHVTQEHRRVQAVATALQKNDISEVGQLLYASHESSRTLFENSLPELDFFVDALAKEPNVLGARLTGGGFGGAVMALTNADFSEEQMDAIAKKYTDQFGQQPQVLVMQSGVGAGRVDR